LALGVFVGARNWRRWRPYPGRVSVLLDLNALSTADVLRVLFLVAVAGAAAYYIGRRRGREQGHADALRDAEERRRTQERYERGQRRWEEVKRARAEGREPDWNALLGDDRYDEATEQ
jgi:hypothetical protein